MKGVPFSEMVRVDMEPSETEVPGGTKCQSIAFRAEAGSVSGAWASATGASVTEACAKPARASATGASAARAVSLTVEQQVGLLKKKHLHTLAALTEKSGGGWEDLKMQRSSKRDELYEKYEKLAMECLQVEGVFGAAVGRFLGIGNTTIKRWSKNKNAEKEAERN